MELKQFEDKLAEMKAALEASITEKNKAEIEVSVKEKTEAIELKLTEMKAAEKVTSEQLEKALKELEIQQAVTDRLQIHIKNNGTKIKPGIKTFADVLTEAVEKKHDTIQKFFRKEIKSMDLEIDMKAVGALSTANVTGSTTWGAQRRNDIVMTPNRRTHVRDLLDVMPAGPGTDFYFMYESGVGEGSIAATSETTAAAAATTQATGLKPQFDLDLVETSVKFEIIAGWMLLSRKAMNNITNLMGFLQKRVPEKLLNAEDAYILYGTGTSPQIKGILTAGNFTAGSAAGATPPLVERLINDMSLLEDTYERTATGIVMRPADYWGFFKNKAAGSGEYDLPQGVVFVNGTLYLMGVPVAKTTALTAGDYVVGDFDNGADLLVQESIRLEFFEQDSTNVRTNQVTLRVEETVALPVYGSTYFIKGSSALS